MSLGFDIWGAIAGAIGTLSLFPMIYNLIKSQLPSERFKTLQETMVETVSLFRSVNEEGLLKDVDYVVETEIKLALLHGEVEDLRRATHCATTFVQEFMEMLRGLSRRIYILCEEIRSIRANISNTSSEERKRLLSEGHVPRPDSTRSVSGWSICTLSRVPLLTTTTAAGMPSAMTDTFQSHLQPIAQDSSEITCDHPTTPTCWPAPSVFPPEATSSQIPQSEHGRGCFTDARNPSNDTTHNTSDGLPRMLSSKSDIRRDSAGKGDPINPTTRTSDAQHTVLHDNPECEILHDRHSDQHNLDSALHSATDVSATFACHTRRTTSAPTTVTESELTPSIWRCTNSHRTRTSFSASRSRRKTTRCMRSRVERAFRKVHNVATVRDCFRSPSVRSTRSMGPLVYPRQPHLLRGPSTRLCGHRKTDCGSRTLPMGSSDDVSEDKEWDDCD